MRTVSALICQGMLDTDLSVKFGLNSFVVRRADLGDELTSHSGRRSGFSQGKSHERKHVAAAGRA
jgi:hypothetical protein